MNERTETRVWPSHHEKQVRGAASRLFVRAMRVDDRSRRIERRVGDRKSDTPALWESAPGPPFKIPVGGLVGREDKAS